MQYTSTLKISNCLDSSITKSNILIYHISPPTIVQCSTRGPQKYLLMHSSSSVRKNSFPCLMNSFMVILPSPLVSMVRNANVASRSLKPRHSKNSLNSSTLITPDLSLSTAQNTVNVKEWQRQECLPTLNKQGRKECAFLFRDLSFKT